MKSFTEHETYYPASRKHWREWLEEHHHQKQFIWLICYKQKSGVPTLTWSEAVEEALCFGWIDSTRKTIDENSFIQLFSKRKPVSTWSKINKEKVAILIQNGQMTTAGLACISIAQQNGSWNILDDVEELIVPKDLENAFKEYPEAQNQYQNISKSQKKMILHRLIMAKQEITRQKRIREIINELLNKT